MTKSRCFNSITTFAVLLLGMVVSNEASVSLDNEVETLRRFLLEDSSDSEGSLSIPEPSLSEAEWENWGPCNPISGMQVRHAVGDSTKLDTKKCSSTSEELLDDSSDFLDEITLEKEDETFNNFKRRLEATGGPMGTTVPSPSASASISAQPSASTSAAASTSNSAQPSVSSSSSSVPSVSATPSASASASTTPSFTPSTSVSSTPSLSMGASPSVTPSPSFPFTVDQRFHLGTGEDARGSGFAVVGSSVGSEARNIEIRARLVVSLPVDTTITLTSSSNVNLSTNTLTISAGSTVSSDAVTVSPKSQTPAAEESFTITGVTSSSNSQYDSLSKTISGTAYFPGMTSAISVDSACTVGTACSVSYGLQSFRLSSLYVSIFLYRNGNKVRTVSRQSGVSLASSASFTLLASDVVPDTVGTDSYSLLVRITSVVPAGDGVAVSRQNTVAVDVLYPYAYNIGGWSPCSETCGAGVRTRTVTCEDDGGNAVADSLCGTKPVTEEACFLGPCNTYDYAIGAWSECTEACGGGTKTRTVECRSQDNEVVANSFCPSPAPATSQACNTQDCEAFTVTYSPYRDCDAACPTTDGYRRRTARCVGDQGTIITPDGVRCPVPAADDLRQSCSITCAEYFYRVGEWGSCSADCDGGVTTRSVKCFRSVAGTVVETAASFCEEAGVPKPTAQQTCNLNKCAIYVYKTGAWGSCSDSCGGEQVRTATCTKVEGSLETAVADSFCSGLKKPATTQPCRSQTEGECFCESFPDCNGHGTCSTAGSGSCDCTDGYTGSTCGVAPSVTCSGTAYGSGQCCTGIVSAASGTEECCEGADPVFDSAGVCCERSELDGCGVCGGNGVFVDSQQICCDGQPDGAGLCCPADYAVDGCGVCAGTDECAIASQFQIGPPAGIANPNDINNVSSVAYAETEDSVAITTATGLGIGSGSVTVNSLSYTAERRLQGGLSLRVRRLNDGTVDADVRAEPEGEPLPNNVDSIQSALTQAGKALGVTVSGVSSLVQQPICGNDLCETGERCAAGDSSGSCCPADCPVPLLVCPFGANGQQCSGRGPCVANGNTGVCACRGVFTGEACEQCQEGYVLRSGECSFVSSAVILPSPTASASVSASPSASPAAAVVVEDEEVDWGSVAAGIVLVGLSVLVVVYCLLRRQKSAKKAQAAEFSNLAAPGQQWSTIPPQGGQPTWAGQHRQNPHAV